jgi:2-amino-4-hydroxy-6-hydroxymethyldihydropteridine diphosphokinase
MIVKKNAMVEGSEQVFIGIGANLGDARAMIDTALQELARLTSGELVDSGVWRSEPSDLGDEAEEFANAVVRIEYRGEPLDLLNDLLAIEVKHGRSRDHGYHTSRTLDLDIIAFADRQIDSDRLCVPHPHAWQRLFVLLPLQEIDPEFRFVNRTESLDRLIADAPALKIGPWTG